MNKKLICICAAKNREREKIMHELSHPYISRNHGMNKSDFRYKFNEYSLIGMNETELEKSNVSPDCFVIVISAKDIEIELSFAKDIISRHENVLVFLNRERTAGKNNTAADAKALSALLGVPVIESSPHTGRGINRLLEEIHIITCKKASCNAYKHPKKRKTALISGLVFAFTFILFFILILLLFSNNATASPF